jgi:hypothetical protein
MLRKMLPGYAIFSTLASLEAQELSTEARQPGEPYSRKVPKAVRRRVTARHVFSGGVRSCATEIATRHNGMPLASHIPIHRRAYFLVASAFDKSGWTW